jgi:hypothetical protein
MRKRLTPLREKYKISLPAEKPFFIDEISWQMFVAHVRDGHTLREIGKETGRSANRVRQIVSLVDHDLQLPRGSTDQWNTVSEDSPIEDLHLSTRARNGLLKRGLGTVRDVLNNDLERGTPSLGLATRREILEALARHGFVRPAEIPDQRLGSLVQLSRKLHRLREQIDASFRQWKDQVDGLEYKIRKLSRD